MSKSTLHRIWFLLVLGIMAVSDSYGAHEHFYNSIEGRHFAADSSVIAKDDKYGTSAWSSIQKNLKVTNVITLALDEDTTLFLIGNHSCKVDLEITYYDSAGHADSLATTLSIAYDSTRSKRFNFRSSFKFNGGYKVKARILVIYYDGHVTSTFPKVFTLLADIYVDRIYHFSCSSHITPSDTFNSINQRLVISWPFDTGADEYDLEYTAYDDSSVIVRKDWPNPYSDFGFLFNGNATRVTVQGTDYAFSLVYNPGWIFYRVRPIHYDQLGNRIEGTWSSAISTTLNLFTCKYHWAGHENLLNWQYTAAFAEQGKRKEVTSYFDGSLRNRQSVTLNNTENKAIVGETIYDYEGRPAVTTLPAPIDSGKIWFYNKYNVDLSGSEYNRKDFDTGACGFTPIGMDSTRGSSRYYSSSNPDASSGFDMYLPDAQGYPFTMTEYTPDNTGRISRQSIAGKTHRFSSGHETKYFYGKPAQEQLDRLFGNEAGDYSHYLENMVMDANGQISVSYIDENGKTIATALAGALPSNMQPIGSYTNSSTLTVNLMDSATNIPQSSTSLESNYTLLATNTGKYTFTYKLFPGNYTDSSCSSSHICTDCLYDVELIVSGDCQNTIVHYDSNLSYTRAFDTACGHQNIVDTFSTTLTPGNYSVTRIITVDPKAINYYTTRYEQRATCIKTYSTFLTNSIANTNFSGCNMTCSTCFTVLGTESAFLNKYITELHNAGEPVSTHQDTLNADTAWTHAYAQCNALCNSFSPCTPLYNSMLADVTLGGQYCKYTLTGSTYTAGDASSMLSSGKYNNSSNPPYRDANGNLDSVVINGVKYPPQQLSITQFVLNWKPSWALSLVWQHPEYCFYTRCIADSASNRYDNNMENISDFATAYSGGYLAPLGYYGAYTSNRDPYFKSIPWGAADSNWMKHRLDKYISFNSGGTITLSLWGTVALMSYCSADTLSGTNMSTCYSPADTILSGSCAGNNNMEWITFRSLYLNLKQHIQDSLDSTYESVCGSYGNCIGLTGCGPSGVYANKSPRHISLEYAASKKLGPSSTSIASQKRYLDSAITATCDSSCLSYAHYWYRQLSNCGSAWSSDSVRLVQGFLAVCEAGCNPNHPTGASTTPYAVPDDSGDVSFEDVIHRVLGVGYNNALCNASQITMPPPYYDSTGTSGPPVTFFKPTPCQCGNIDTAYHIYYTDSISGETKYKNFGDFLTKYYGDSISPANAYAVRTLCRGSCFFAPTPIQMPLWMSCCQDSMKPQQVTVGGGGWAIKYPIGETTYSPQKRFDAVSFAIRDSGYVVGGIGPGSDTGSSNLWIWSQASGIWTVGASESRRAGGIGFPIEGKGYVGLGYNLTTGNYLKDLRQYNPHTNSWSTLGVTFHDTGRMNAFSFAIGDTAYIGCGDSEHFSPTLTNTLFSSFYKYDSTSGTWMKKRDFPGGKRAGLAAFSIGNYGYAGCGVDNLGHLRNDMWKFDPSTDTWSSIAPLPISGGLYGPVSFTLNGKGYVGMGFNGTNTDDSSSYTKLFWQYDPTVNKWYSITPFRGSKSALGVAFSIGSYGYAGAGTNRYYSILGGGDNTVLSDFEQLSITDTIQFAAPACCISCANIDTAINHFKSTYPSIHDTSVTYPNTLASYLNQYFGFNLTYGEYIQFYNECITSSGIIHLHDSVHLGLTLCNRAQNEAPPVVDTNTCYTYLMMDAQYNAMTDYNTYIDSVQNAFQANYIAHCMQVGDSFHVAMPFDEYHYTLYYYDQAGNLVKTVPPQGVHPITAQASLDSVTYYRAGKAGYTKPVYPIDSMQTKYFYNTLNSPIKQQTPDGDSVHFWYDRLGRIVLSQNAIERPLTYNYVSYDAIGRVIEIGQLSDVPANLPSCFHCVGCTISYGVLPVLPDTFTRNQSELQNFIYNSTRTQVTHTYYDSVTYSNIPLVQQNLRKRIASITYEEKNDYNVRTYDNALHYNYDIEGHVVSMIIDVPHDSIVKQRYKKINYYYDLISGNVNEFIYEQDSIDQFIHNYEYDADERLTEVQTSHDSLFWENDAEYEYYDHGPIAREVLGRRQVQGIDYAYTLNGWLKGANSSIAKPSYDMGHDGDVHDANNTVARDAYGFTLNYFNGDYRSIASTNFQATGLPITSLYDGNITGATYSIQPLAPKTIGYIYQYDQLNRYRGDSIFKNPDTINNNWSTRTGINDLKEKVSFDENGNILMYLRHGNTMNGGHLAMDSLTYHYTKGRDQLTQVNDAVGSTNYTVDIDNETSKRNYQYNGIGELAKDSAGGLDTITWTIYGKVKEIKKHNGDSIIFFYDPMGNRLEKRYYPHSSTSDTTKYGRDAGGDIMAVYDRKKDTVRLTEWDIYGSKRVGSIDTILRMQKPSVGVGTIDSLTLSYLEGQKQYELDNHLGNVLVTISDKKIPVDTVLTDTLAKYYLPLVISAQDYYPFGMIEPGRSYQLSGDSSYRFAFNGKEKTNEMYGSADAYDYGMRMYDPRLGRFMSVDPLTMKFPYYSPYMYAGDKPISATDLDGMEDIYYMNSFLDKNGQAVIDLLNSTDIGFEFEVEFRNTNPNYNQLTGNLDNGNQGADLFVASAVNITGPDEGGVTNRFSFGGLFTIFQEDGVANFEGLEESIMKARECGSGPEYDYWVKTLTKEVLMSDEILNTLKQKRDIILVRINPDITPDGFSPSTQPQSAKLSSKISATAWILGHEFIAHANTYSRNIQPDVEAEHGMFSGMKSMFDVIVPGSLSDKLGQQLERSLKPDKKPAKDKKKDSDKPGPNESHQNPRFL
jgi:RHS repeat-associated protein